MKKIYFAYVGFILAIIIFILSCKHEFPAPNPPINGGENPPVISIGCSPDTTYFQQQVLPIFVSNCSSAGCHDEASHQESIVLTDYNSIMKSVNILPGQPDHTKTWKKIVDPNANDRMPPAPYNALNQQQKDLIYKWITQGAKNNGCQELQCDTINVFYSSTIKTLLANKCIGCHNSINSSGGNDLSVYNIVKALVDDGSLWGSVTFSAGFSSMPKNGQKLSNCELNQIYKWITNGAPNN